MVVLRLCVKFVEAEEVLLGVGPDLDAGPRADVVFELLPVAAIELDGFEERLVFRFGPAAQLLFFVVVVGWGARV